MLKRILAMLAVFAGLAQVAAQAQEEQEELWSATPHVEPQGDIPGRFDDYTLVLSWSPTHCSLTERGTDDAQCARDDGVHFGFVLDGLWPRFEQRYPERCRTRWRPFVSEQVTNTLLDVMPSRRRVLQEYLDHGTCTGLRPEPFFALARRLFNSIRIPKRYRNPFETQLVSQREIAADFLQANPGLRPDMIEITCEGLGHQLSDVRFCLTKDGRLQSCGLNERRGEQCRASQMHVLPVRSTKWDYANDRLPPLKPPRPDPSQRTFEVPRPR